jgi:GNAT superfamily N-acetyltransferase
VAQPIFRSATRADVPAILDLLTDDDIARSREAAPAPTAPDPTPPGPTSPGPTSPGPTSPGLLSGTTPDAASMSAPGPSTGCAAGPAATETRAVTAEAVDAACWAAFEAIDADPRNELIVADQDGDVVGTCQLTFTPSLSRRGAERMTIEAVRVRGDQRGRGVGRAMMLWALDRARERGCGLAQLTTDKRRTDAHRFYASLGFEPSHVGFKLNL